MEGNRTSRVAISSQLNKSETHRDTHGSPDAKSTEVWKVRSDRVASQLLVQPFSTEV